MKNLLPYFIYAIIAAWAVWGIVAFVKAPPLGRRFAIFGVLGLCGSFALFLLFGMDVFTFLVHQAVRVYGTIGNPWISVPLLVLAWCAALVLVAFLFGLPLIVASRFAPLKRDGKWYQNKDEFNAVVSKPEGGHDL